MRCPRCKQNTILEDPTMFILKCSFCVFFVERIQMKQEIQNKFAVSYKEYSKIIEEIKQRRVIEMV